MYSAMLSSKKAFINGLIFKPILFTFTHNGGNV